MTVYPSENFYYYRIIANGQHFFGKLVSSAHDRDNGVLHSKVGWLELKKEDGLVIKKINEFRYIVIYEKTNYF